MEVHHHPRTEKKQFKEYILEFFMIFLAVTMGFFAEGLREKIVEHGKEKHFVKSILADLKKDSIDLTFCYPAQQMLVNKMDSALKIPIDKIRDIPSQDSFYRNFSIFYANYWLFIQNNNTITQLRSAGGFSVFQNQIVIDSINMMNNYYESWVRLNADSYSKTWEKTGDLATQLIKLPIPPSNMADSSFSDIPDHTEVFTQYNKVLLEQLYTYIRQEKGFLLFYVECEKEYMKRVVSLIRFLEKEYHMV